MSCLHGDFLKPCNGQLQWQPFIKEETNDMCMASFVSSACVSSLFLIFSEINFKELIWQQNFEPVPMAHAS